KGAKLAGADLFGADLTGADLTGADLSESRLSRAILTDAKLDGVNFKGALMPDGSTHEEAERSESGPRPRSALKSLGFASGGLMLLESQKHFQLFRFDPRFPTRRALTLSRSGRPCTGP